MKDTEIKELWEFVGSSKQQFKYIADTLVSIDTKLTSHNKKLDRHLTLHKYFNRTITAITTLVIAWWKS